MDDKTKNDNYPKDATMRTRGRIDAVVESSGRSACQHPRDSLASMLDDGSSFAASNKSLLFIPCQINGRPVEIMVDTGAQSSVISKSLMKRLGLERKLNRRFAGTARGVGLATIIGRVENCPIQIHHVEFHMFLSCLDVSHDILILGLDQMKRFKCLVDLENKRLIFGGTEGIQVEFLF